MRLKLSYSALLLAGGAAAAIALAPIAAAAPASGQSDAGTTAPAAPASGAQQSCIGLGATQSQCQSPGNVQIYDSPPQVDYFPYAGGAT